MKEKKFKPLLAVQADLEKLRFPVYLSPKFDGIRTLVLNGRAVTRNLKPIPNKHIRETLEANAHLLEGFDGELVVGNPTAPDCFNTTTRAVMSFEGEPDFTYYVFDKVNSGSYVDRWVSFANSKPQNLPDFVQIVPQYLVTNDGTLQSLEQDYVEQGYEGVMIRSPEGIYKFGRSTVRQQILLKIKRFIDTEAKIVGFTERLHNANKATTNALGHTERSSHKENMVPMDTLGALVVKSPDFEGTFEIGTGFTDNDRQEVWDNRDKYLGLIAKFKYQECGVKDKPRFPVYLGIRSESDM